MAGRYVPYYRGHLWNCLEACRVGCITVKRHCLDYIFIKEIITMDNFADERDFLLLDKDKYTFFILRLVIGGDCKLLLTDHEKLIICYSCPPYPVWIWTPDNTSNEEMERAYSLVKENSLLDGKHSFNLKYELAEYFIKRSAEEGVNLSILINMFAYDCLEPVRPTDVSDGGLYNCTPDDVDEVTEFIDMFHRELGIDQKSIEGYRADAEEFIGTGKMYFWKDEQGHSTASCKYAPNGDMASINLVYTRPECRRKHYAENLVYEVTIKAMNDGYVPTLYTDADYKASNACYEKIGYVLRGKLCSIG